MRKIPTQGVHHITLLGADRQTSIGPLTPAAHVVSAGVPPRQEQ